MTVADLRLPQSEALVGKCLLREVKAGEAITPELLAGRAPGRLPDASLVPRCSDAGFKLPDPRERPVCARPVQPLRAEDCGRDAHCWTSCASERQQPV